MKYTLFTLLPNIFESFLQTSLVGRAISQEIISVNTVNWRNKYGIGGYKQIDDKPYGGGSGMVLQPDPIYNALVDENFLSPLFVKPRENIVHSRMFPNNEDFLQYLHTNPNHRKVTISLTPRGFPLNQNVSQWLSTCFDEIAILCGRYEGFDARVSECVDLELSLGDFVLNGGEVAAMALVESVSRLLPGFVTKTTSVEHESFSPLLNLYSEQEEYVVGKKNIFVYSKTAIDKVQIRQNTPLFDNTHWKTNILPRVEHPQYTRPESWMGYTVPQVLIEGNHKHIQNYRKNWYL
jgi:tRNA (guanine37-N1)-methyltransferase